MKTLFTLAIAFAINLSCLAQSDYVADELLIQSKPGLDVKSILENYTILGDQIEVKLLSKIMSIHQVSFSNSSLSAPQVLRVLKKDPAIINVQLNHFISKRETLPNDPQINSQWHHVNDGVNGGLENADIDTDLAWDITTGGLTALGDTIVVCVIEGGNLQHLDLIDNAWINYGEIPENGIDDDENGFDDDYRGWNVELESDENVLEGPHGTNVMGMIGATGNNDLGVVGANWNVKIMSVAGEDLDDEASVIAAYNYPLVQRKLYNETSGERGAFVVVTNASWGIDGFPWNPIDAEEEVPLWSAYYDTLGTYGILNCGATANNAYNIDEVGDIPTGVDSDYMISVTATNSSDIRTFSAYGLETVDLGAPGAGIFTTFGGSSYESTSGTSFASPLTAGVIALLYSAPCEEFANLIHDDPQGGAEYVRTTLFNGVDPIENLQNEVVTGGRLNAFNSLQFIMASCGACVNPIGFNHSVTDDYQINFSWTSFSENDSVVIRYRPIGAEEWLYSEYLLTDSYTFADLDICSVYEFELASKCTGESLELLEYTSNTTVELFEYPISSVEDISSTTAGVTWPSNSSLGLYEVYYRISGESEYTLAGTTTNGSFEITGLDSCAFYDVFVKPACTEEFDLSYELQIRTKGCGHCIDTEFCQSISESTQYEYIESIAIGDFTNSSGDNDGYGLFENTGLELESGGVYDIELTPGFNGDAFDQEFIIWIDLNQNGDFSDEEIVYQSSQGYTDPVEGTISIPSDVELGSTRLRVAMKWVDSDDEFSPCGNLEEGEIEDYCISITASTVGIEERDAGTFRLYPNPTNGEFFIEISSDSGLDLYSLEIMDLSGKRIAYQNMRNGTNPIQLNLAPGAYIYMISRNGEVLMSDKLIIVQ